MPRDGQGLRGWVRWAANGWATRSLAVGAVATLLDVAVLLTCVKGLHFPNPIGAMVGVACGSTLTFFANRHFAFRDHDPRLAPQAMKFVVATSVGMCVHGACVYVLANRLNVPLVIAKLLADVAVFSVGQLFLLRYVVFPKRAQPQGGAAPVLPLHRPPLKDHGLQARRARLRRTRVGRPPEG